MVEPHYHCQLHCLFLVITTLSLVVENKVELQYLGEIGTIDGNLGVISLYFIMVMVGNL